MTHSKILTVAAVAAFCMTAFTAVADPVNVAPTAQRFYPNPPPADTANTFIPTVPTVSHDTFRPYVPVLPPATRTAQPNYVSPADRFNPTVPVLPPAEVVPPPQTVDPVQVVEPTQRFHPNPPPADPAQIFYP